MATYTRSQHAPDKIYSQLHTTLPAEQERERERERGGKDLKEREQAW
jgi:hypothetical protein